MTGKGSQPRLLDTETDLLSPMVKMDDSSADEEVIESIRIESRRTGIKDSQGEDDVEKRQESNDIPASGKKILNTPFEDALDRGRPLDDLDRGGPLDDSPGLQQNASSSQSHEIIGLGFKSSISPRSMRPEPQSEDEIDLESSVVVPDDTSNFAQAVALAIGGPDNGKRGKIFVRPGVYGWSGDIVVRDASLEIRGRDGAVLCGKLKLLDGSSGFISGVTIGLFGAGVSDSCLTFASFDEPSDWGLAAVRVFCVGATCVNVGGITSLRVDSCAFGYPTPRSFLAHAHSGTKPPKPLSFGATLPQFP